MSNKKVKVSKIERMNCMCNVRNCEYNESGICHYCGDYYDLNDEDCISFQHK